MRIVDLLNDHSIPHNDQRKGWVQVKCCWCDDRGQHLGIADSGAVNCWRCGTHSLINTAAKLLSVRLGRAKEILLSYGYKGSRVDQKQANEMVRMGPKRPFQYPSGVGDLSVHHKRYLGSRGFDAEKLVQEWRIMATGPVSRLDDMDYKWRVVIPVHWEGRVVSFQSRDIANVEGRIRYMACPKDREIVPYKSIVYGKQEVWMKAQDEWFVCVEGVTDVWKLGSRAFATFGTAVTHEQVVCISKQFRKVVVAFDAEIQAQIEARKLTSELQMRGVKTFITKPPASDPGDMSYQEAAQWMEEVIRSAAMSESNKQAV